MEAVGGSNHTTPGKGFTCDLCQIPFFSHTRFVKHRKLHTDAKPFICAYCNETFSHVIELQDHKDKEHMCKKSFKCPSCHKTFASRMALSEHSWRHTGDKLYECSICRKRYSSKGNLKIHAQKHSYMNNYACTLCTRDFTTYSSLERHMSQHSGFKPYSCRFCSVKFLQVFQLRNHERTHTGDKPFKCPHCDKRFFSSSACRNHQQVHHQLLIRDAKACQQPSFNGHESSVDEVVAMSAKGQTQITCPFCKTALSVTCNVKKHLLRHKELCLSVTEAKSFAKALKKYLALPNPRLRVEKGNIQANYHKDTNNSTSDERQQKWSKRMEKRGWVRKVARLQPYKCPICHETFKLHRHLRYHIIKRHKEEAEMMGICTVASVYERAIREWVFANGRRAGCPDTKGQLLQSHSSQFGEEPFKEVPCKSCPMNEVATSEDKVLKCWLCPRTFVSAAEVVIHMTDDHGSHQHNSTKRETGDNVTLPGRNVSPDAHSSQRTRVSCVQSYSCLKCKKAFSSQTVLSMHEIAHNILAIDTGNFVSVHDKKPALSDSTYLMFDRSASDLRWNVKNSSSDNSKVPSNTSLREAAISPERLNSSSSSACITVPCSSYQSINQSEDFYRNAYSCPKKKETLKPRDKTTSPIAAAVKVLSKNPESCLEPDVKSTSHFQETSTCPLRYGSSKFSVTVINVNRVNDVNAGKTPEMKQEKDGVESNADNKEATIGPSMETSPSISQLSKLCESLVPDYLPVSRNSPRYTRTRPKLYTSENCRLVFENSQPRALLVCQPTTNGSSSPSSWPSNSCVQKEKAEILSSSKGFQFVNSMKLIYRESK